VGVYSISTNQNTATAWPIYVPINSTVTFYAKPIPLGEWPVHRPVWGGQASGSGTASKTLTFTEPGTNIVIAICGGNYCSYSAKTATVVVVDIDIGVDSSDEDSAELDVIDGIDQIATVKGTGNVILKATVNPDTPEIRALLEWQGASEDPTDPTKATVSRSSSAKREVSVLLDGTTWREANVWVVWATIDLITSDPPGTPEDSDVAPDDHDCPVPSFEYGALGGPYFYPQHENDPYCWRYLNGILIRASLSPDNITDYLDVLDFVFKRTKEKNSWYKDANTDEWSPIIGAYDEPGTDDSPGSCSQDLSVSEYNNIYNVDGPRINPLRYTVEVVHRASFQQWV
jgi:hypothetical protein